MTAAPGWQKGRSEELWHGVGRSRGGHGYTPDLGPYALARFLWVAKQVGEGGRGEASNVTHPDKMNVGW